ncbi:MAG TPA: peptidoglycan-associated lipoprotein Pal [Lentisphaeria bacterium]|nr:MAG: peptidoglycan-associated lipoprotein [Lentisphaerae bacterium GWF2_38_69]HBM17542.1 peptidoglycan-associated lipoprotein Pal [Lentisphaeria bacterium]
MKFSRLIAISVLTAITIFFGACSNPDSGQMKPGGTDEFGAGSGDLASGFGINGTDSYGDSGSLPGRPHNSWIPIPGVSLEPVYFAFDNYNVSSQQIPRIEAAAKYLQANSSVGLIIEGHCDERGSAEYNMGLGEKRALAVREYLVNLGIPETRLQTISYGLEKPAAAEHNESAWMKNRRDELIPAKMN